ncbi:Thermolysin [uncultured Candidatus Thioglobus sp.]|nr:Thermolysin [uncultured Candidatus Thioglobus sp.]
MQFNTLLQLRTSIYQALIIVGLLLLSACGGGGGSSSDGSGDSDSNSGSGDSVDGGGNTGSSAIETGQFQGSAVRGLTYSTPTLTGTTDEQGRYQYRTGESIKFYLGRLYLGQSLATKTLYPSDIAASDSAEVKIAQLLQTLDADNNADNGIDVSRLSSASSSNYLYLPDGDLSQQDIDTFDSSKTLVSETDASNFLTQAIENDRDTSGYLSVSGGETRGYGFTFSTTGLNEVTIATLACTQVSCCKVSVDGRNIVDQNRLIRFSLSRLAGETAAIQIQALGTQTCYYKTPVSSAIRTSAQVQSTINAQGDGNNYPTLNVIKPNQYYYLNDSSRNANIQTLKSIGLGDIKLTEHSAKKAEYLDKDGVDAHANSIRTYDYLNTVLGINSYNNSGGDLPAITNYLYPRSDITSCGSNSKAGSWFNAFYTNNRIFYTPAKPDQNRDKSLSAVVNVAAHEWGHAITDNYSNLAYQRESGAINEAFSDWLGIAIEQYYTTDTKTWTIGLKDNPFRSLKDPSSTGNYPDTYKGTHWRATDNNSCTPDQCENDYCGVHTNSSVGNKMFYLLSVGGDHNGVTVTGIGTDNAMKIALSANRNQWTSSTTFHNAKAGMIAASVPFGNTDDGVNMQQQVELAWEAVNVRDQNMPATP